MPKELFDRVGVVLRRLATRGALAECRKFVARGSQDRVMRTLGELRYNSQTKKQMGEASWSLPYLMICPTKILVRSAVV
jgi:hypothetical protein